MADKRYFRDFVRVRNVRWRSESKGEFYADLHIGAVTIPGVQYAAQTGSVRLPKPLHVQAKWIRTTLRPLVIAAVEKFLGRQLKKRFELEDNEKDVESDETSPTDNADGTPED